MACGVPQRRCTGTRTTQRSRSAPSSGEAQKTPPTQVRPIMFDSATDAATLCSDARAAHSSLLPPWRAADRIWQARCVGVTAGRRACMCGEAAAWLLPHERRQGLLRAAFARLRANASAIEYGRAVSLCLSPVALATASEEELDRVCKHTGTVLKLLLEPMTVNEGEAEEAGVHVPQRVVAKAEQMRRETAAVVLQAVIDHPTIARVLGLEKGALIEELKICRQDA